MAECEAEGISKNACYVAEQNRKASINSVKAVVKRYNASYYEISGNGYTASISLNADGVETASYTKAHSCTHGFMQVIQKNTKVSGSRPA